jgi:DNA-directed RNA polymerase subunit RPC12/RpoP
MALQQFNCPNCGGALSFEPGVQELVCPYCESVVNVEAMREYDETLQTEVPEESLDWSYSSAGWAEGEQSGLSVYSCNSCGGEIVGDDTLGATSCPFCGNPVVFTSKFSGDFRPDIVIPFKYDKSQALAALKQHYLGKKLLPKAFKAGNHLDEVKGVYVPFWLFDADTQADLRYRARRIRRWSDSTHDYTETSVYNVVRRGSLSYVQVPIDGSTVMDDTLMESIEPFYWKEAVDFRTAYLAGFLANKYDVDADSSIARANERIRNSTLHAFESTVRGYDSLTPEYRSIRLQSGGVKYALLPVWMLSTSWKGKNFLFAMNGQTGKFVGDLPVDNAAAGKWLAGLTLGIGALIAAIALIAQNLIY